MDEQEAPSLSEAEYQTDLREAAESRLLASQEERRALDALNAAVRAARASGMRASTIAECIGTTRQRVYEILREG
jgi:hypothetical protein